MVTQLRARSERMSYCNKFLNMNKLINYDDRIKIALTQQEVPHSHRLTISKLVLKRRDISRHDLAFRH